MDKKAALVIGGAVAVTGGVMWFTPPQLNPDAGLAPIAPTDTPQPTPVDSTASSANTGGGSTNTGNSNIVKPVKPKSSKSAEESGVISNIEINSEEESDKNSQSAAPKPTASTNQSSSSAKPSATPTPSHSATPTPTPQQTVVNTPPPAPKPTPTPTPPPTPIKQTVNGTFTGDAINVSYGIVQVRITVTNSKITDAQAIQSPTGGKSGSISNSSIPILRQNTLAAQSAAIRGVSGATFTSNGWIRSLTTAIARAGI